QSGRSTGIGSLAMLSTWNPVSCCLYSTVLDGPPAPACSGTADSSRFLRPGCRTCTRPPPAAFASRRVVSASVPPSRCLRTVDADQPVSGRPSGQGCVNATGQKGVIVGILGRGQDAAVRRALAVQAFVVPTVVRQYRAADGMSTVQNIGIRGRSPAV